MDSLNIYCYHILLLLLFSLKFNCSSYHNQIFVKKKVGHLLKIKPLAENLFYSNLMLKCSLYVYDKPELLYNIKICISLILYPHNMVHSYRFRYLKYLILEFC